MKPAGVSIHAEVLDSALEMCEVCWTTSLVVLTCATLCDDAPLGLFQIRRCVECHPIRTV